MNKIMTMRAALSDPALFGLVLAGPTWGAWRVLLLAICGEPLTAEELAIFTKLTGRATSPTQAVLEAWLIFGRRGGKSFAISVLIAFIACLVDHRGVLNRGERGVVIVAAANTVQAQSIFNFVRGIITGSKMLKGMIEGITADSIRLRSGIDIEVRPASFRTLRGITCVAAIFDEIAFFRSDESRNPDAEILRAARPSLATTGGPILAISSPYSRRGELWRMFRKHYGPDGSPEILVAQASSRTMNPSLPESVVARAYEDDPASAAAEYGGEFRTDIEAFVSREALDAVTVPGLIELPFQARHTYTGFVDPSGGSSDSFTLAIAHKHDDVAVLDLIREQRPPFSPDDTIAAFADELKRYGLSRVRGDAYSGEFVREGFRKHGIEYDLSDKPKSKIYAEALPLIHSRRVELLDRDRLLNQLAALERRTARGGRDSIDHPAGQHDDVCNAACGALVGVGTATCGYDSSMKWV